MVAGLGYIRLCRRTYWFASSYAGDRVKRYAVASLHTTVRWTPSACSCARRTAGKGKNGGMAGGIRTSRWHTRRAGAQPDECCEGISRKRAQTEPARIPATSPRRGGQWHRLAHDSDAQPVLAQVGYVPTGERDSWSAPQWIDDSFTPWANAAARIAPTLGASPKKNSAALGGSSSKATW